MITITTTAIHPPAIKNSINFEAALAKALIAAIVAFIVVLIPFAVTEVIK